MKNKLDYKNKENGFTLIELLMVISIITLLSSIFLSYLGSARAKSRDSVRLSDMKQIGTAANLYYEDKGILPTSVSDLVPTYLSSEPKDPKSGQSYSFEKVGDKNAYVVSTEYETQFRLNDGEPQQVGITIGDIDIIALCLIARSSGLNYPNCNDSNDSNDQIVGVTSGHRGSGGTVDPSEEPVVGLEWSDEMGIMDWDLANETCLNLGWRLPTIDELLIALNNQFTDGGSNPGGFVLDVTYWSSKDFTPEGYPDTAQGGGTIMGSVYTFADYKYYQDHVRCVR